MPATARAPSIDRGFMAAVMRGSRVFKPAAPGRIDALAQASRLRAYAAGEVIATTERAQRIVCVVEHGVAEIFATSEEGDQSLSVALLGRGDSFGEAMAMASAREGAPGALASLRAVSVTNSAIIEIPAAEFRAFVAEEPAVAQAAGAKLAGEMAELLSLIDGLAFAGLVEIRLARYLLRRAEHLGVREGARIQIPERLTHGKLALALGVDRRSVLEALNLWQDGGIIAVDKQQHLTILQLDRLRIFAKMRRGSRGGWNAAAWLDQIDLALARGCNLEAWELALEALRRPSLARDPLSRHRAVLASARSGAVHEAWRMLGEFGLAENAADEDAAALEARLRKDLWAQERDRSAKRALALRSAECYEAVHKKFGGYYAAINAATMFIAAGDRARAREVATEVLGHLGEHPGSYYEIASAAEAALVLGKVERAAQLLERARQCDDADRGKIASTRRQMRMLCGLLEVPERRILDALRQPPVAHFIADGGFAESFDEARFAGGLRALAERAEPAWIFGGLANPAEIVAAETLIEAGAEFNAVLPDRAIVQSGRVKLPGHAEWARRSGACLDRAARIAAFGYETSAGTGDDRYLTSRLAMGQAIQRARELESESIQLCLSWDGGGTSVAGAAMRTWRAAGQRIVAGADIVDPARLAEQRGPAGPVPPAFVCLDGGADRADEAPANALGKPVTIEGGCRVWLFASALEAAAFAAQLARRSEAGVTCDLAPVTEPRAASLALQQAALAPRRPAVSRRGVYATEPFHCELLLGGYEGETEFAGKVGAVGGGGRIAVFVLLPERGR
jgi:CRP-like cAMP-binding protein